MSARDPASARQLAAARPEISTWLSANAGSGKTKVLTDRVARLLLNGVLPEHILCLTYTKAAASEMQNRLFERLGAWSMRADAALRDELQQLGLETELDAAMLRKARTLFARAIEAPGGLKIQTIHSFCAALLRRFPLEAGVSPQFHEMDERASRLLAGSILDDISASDQQSVIGSVAAYCNETDVMDLIASVLKHRQLFAQGSAKAEIWGRLNLPVTLTGEALCAGVFTQDAWGLIGTLVSVLSTGSPTDQRNGEKLAKLSAPSLEALGLLEQLLLWGEGSKKNTPFSAKIDAFPTKALRDGALQPHLPALHALMARVEDTRDQRLGLMAAQKTAVLYAFAAVFLPAYEREKQARGWLDFDDLILKARGLLTDQAVADWVLYRLDGGIDHILVDEAQDTSPIQWQVIEKLAQEFTSGQGARSNRGRTIFVVGDKKQSIYSFQGADPAEFDRMKADFAARLKPTDTPLFDASLAHSFRSSSAILALVDKLFAPAPGVSGAAGEQHLAFKTKMPGRVDLWPALEAVEKQKDRSWERPVDLPDQDNHLVQLARHIAEEIDHMITQKVAIPEEIGKTGRYHMRPVRAADFLILVQRRSDLFQEIIRACKAQNLPIAGADRLKLGAEMAVKDLLALLAFLATPEDDLSLAVVLKSPLVGWDEQTLFTLAQGRGRKFLWQVLRAATDQHGHLIAMLNDLLLQADFLRPYELLERVLTHYAGRKLLLGRLGQEAEDGLNALLGQAMAYERSEVPSLTGFLVWMQSDGLEIKRQADQDGNQIRVMTVHGAKGLESPIVILPDTAKRDARLHDDLLVAPDGAFWKVPRAEMPPRLRELRERKLRAEEEERDRLLYVAITRAEKWLIVAAAGDLGADQRAWYQKISLGVEALAAQSQRFPTGMGRRFDYGVWGPCSVEVEEEQSVPSLVLEDFFNEVAPPVPAQPKPLSPSDLGGEKSLQSDAEETDEDAKLRGLQIHKLLEVLPSLDPTLWPDMCSKILDQAGLPASAETFEALKAEVLGVLKTPDLQFLFGFDALAEVALSGPVAGLENKQVYGIVDRLVVQEAAVWLVDFKSNAQVPESPAEVPLGLLRQMAAYAAVIARTYPDHQIIPALLWTKQARLMPLPDALLANVFSEPSLDL